MAKVVVGLSGGVDSSVAAYLLKQKGHEVIALFMRNWHDESVILDDECPWIDDSADAMLVAEKLGIPFQTIDLSKEYKERIVDYMFGEYQNGRTPNPDVLCNREIKFDTFLKHALALGADFVATGHYCRKAEIEVDGVKKYRLLSGQDQNKDQSYFLCQLSQAQLSKALFPIGELQKSEVRKIASDLDLVTAEKKDSQGLCFVGKISLPDFLQQQLKPKEGDVILLPNKPMVAVGNEFDKTLSPKPNLFDGIPIGKHQGAHFYTIGQRKGLNIGGFKDPLFVAHTDTHTNTIYVAEGESNKAIHRQGLFIKNEDVHWVRDDKKLQFNEKMDVRLRIRYRQPLFDAQLIQSENKLHIIFKEPQRGVAAGQFAVWYLDDEVIGSGVIA